MPRQSRQQDEDQSTRTHARNMPGDSRTCKTDECQSSIRSPSQATRTPCGNWESSVPWSFSCPKCVSHASRASTSRTASSASPSEKCVGCGCGRSESTTITSTPCEPAERGVRDLLHIRQIRDAARSRMFEKKPDRLHRRVLHRQRSDLQITVKKRPVDDPGVRFHIALVDVFLGKRPAKHRFQRHQAFLRRMQRQRVLLMPAERPQLVKSRHVVQMGVGVNHRIDRPQILPQRLRPQVRPGIHQHRHIPRPHDHRRTQAGVPRVRRCANRAPATDHRHSHRGARAEKCERKIRRH